MVPERTVARGLGLRIGTARRHRRLTAGAAGPPGVLLALARPHQQFGSRNGVELDRMAARFQAVRRRALAIAWAIDWGSCSGLATMDARKFFRRTISACLFKDAFCVTRFKFAR